MSKKLQSYYVLKLSSDRLKRANYNLNITISEARKNDELISLGDSQVLRTLRKLKNIEVDQERIASLFAEKRQLKFLKDTPKNREKLKQIEDEIDNILFVPEIISLFVKDHRHYIKIVENGLTVNGKKYVRLLCGAGNARRSTVILVQEQWWQVLQTTLDNNRSLTIPVTPAKYNAYFALANSSTLSVSTPKFCVVKDCLKNIDKEVIYITEIENNDYQLDDRVISHTSNLFDGQGLISPKRSEMWAKELELDHIPAAYCIRGPFLKGMVCTFDFHQFANENDKTKITDVWGNELDINDVDVIITESQLKLWSAYASQQEYERQCKTNNLGWGISRFTPKVDKDYTNTNYQFLQVLNLDDKQIESLCQYTLNFFYNVSGGDIRYSILYLMGKYADEEITQEYVDNLTDPILKALFYNKELINDPYIKQTITRTLNKKIRDSYMGVLAIPGNYQVMISDPYAQAQHIFGLSVVGLLENKEHYSAYWNNKNVKNVSALRAPLTWKSENNVLNLKKNQLTEKWYKYIYSGIIYNVFGDDCLRHGGSDFDFDIICTTSSKEFINGSFNGPPVTYKENSAPKTVIDQASLYMADIQSMTNKIGFLTNCSTTLYSMMEGYDKDTEEYKELYKRAIVCRLHQGYQIDRGKGLLAPDIPDHWTKFIKGEDDLSGKEKDILDFNNSIIIDKRPYFMRYLYPHYNKKYETHKSIYDTITITKFGYDVDTLVKKKSLTEEERQVFDAYNDRGFFINTDCVMNKICWYMEKNIKEMRFRLSKNNQNIIDILVDKDIVIDQDKLKEMEKLFLEYKNNKRDMHDGLMRSVSLSQFVIYVRQKANEISSNESELANLAVQVCYDTSTKSKDFVWQVFGDGVVQNVIKNSSEKMFVPVLDAAGEIEYFGKQYTFVDMDLK